jgi:hypothetical protein
MKKLNLLLICLILSNLFVQGQQVNSFTTSDGEILYFTSVGDGLQKPEALSKFGRSDAQKDKIHDNRNLQPARNGQLSPT